MSRNPGHTVHIQWVPSHSHVDGNETADRLAKDGAYSVNLLKGTHTLTHLKRAAREELMRQWKAIWIKSIGNGCSGFAPADRFAPSWTPRKHFIATPRELAGRVFQCRTGHGHFGGYYIDFVKDEDPSCSCGTNIQTRSHILRDCPEYDPYRHILQCATTTLDLPTLLGSEAGIEALTGFIAASGAFKKRDPLTSRQLD